jgi:quinoprotein glucose dehydrogenase
MTRALRRFALAGGPFAVVLLWVATGVSGQSAAQSGTQSGEWRHYTADLRGTRYSPLDQITADNFNRLEVAWRFKTDNLGTRPEFKLEGTPLMIKGVLYATAGTRRSVVALDAKTGELMWVHSLREGKRAAVAPRQLSGRGLAFWSDGRGDDRVIYVTTGYRLVELNAKNGAMIASFGKDGIVDLKTGMVTGSGQQIDLETGEAGLHSTPAVVKDTVIVGSSFKEGMTVKTHNNTKGLVRAFDVHTGKLLWTFNTVPRPGEVGNETWENGSWKENGNTGVWTQITADEDLGLVYLAVEDPTSDFYGGHRPGNNLFGDSLVCVDLKTGQRKWHFQIVHHPIWDYDLSSAPILLDANVNGKLIKAVAVPSKQSYLYVFDRVTGQPIWPIEEKPVPASDVPGEKASPTQPFPTKPPAYARTYVKVPDDLIDFTPQFRTQALDILKRYRVEQTPFVPYIQGDVNGRLGTLNIGNTNGGTNWPGAGGDPETHVVYLPASNAAVTTGSLVEPPEGFSDIRYVAGAKGREFRVAEGPGYGSAADFLELSGEGTAGSGRGGRGGRGGGAPQAGAPANAGAATGSATAAGGRGAPAAAGFGLSVDGLPIVKPPYGVLSAINLDRGELMWQVPHGDTPDNVRNHPALKAMNIPKTGQSGAVGLLVTKTLVIMGDPQVTTTSDHPRGAMLRAYDKNTGKQVGAVWMPAQQSGSPMTYMWNGKQYIIVAVSGGNYSGEYLAFSLPSESLTTTQAAAR